MKRMTNWMIAAAALAAAAGGATAQTLKADIPFPFHAASQVMAPGSYTVSKQVSGGWSYVLLHNRDNGKSAILQFTVADAPKRVLVSGRPTLTFECAGARCILREAWPGYDEPLYRFRGPKLEGDGPVRVAEILLMPVKGD